MSLVSATEIAIFDCSPFVNGNCSIYFQASAASQSGTEFLKPFVK